jgi:hypothetical protein
MAKTDFSIKNNDAGNRIQREGDKFIFFFGSKKFIGSAYYRNKSGVLLTVRPVLPKGAWKDPAAAMALRPKPLPNPFEVFYENALFNEILDEIKLNHYNDVVYLRTIMKNKGISKNISPSSPDRKFLEQIRDMPGVLSIDFVLERFEKIVETARWGSGDDRLKSLNLLKEHFIPKVKEPLPLQIRLPLILLKKLADHVSIKIKDISIPIENDRPYTFREYIRNGDNLAEDNIPELKNQIVKDSFIKKHVKGLSDEELIELILAPSKLAERVLVNHLHISRSTLYRQQ